MYFKNRERGFIQIPILLIAVLALTLAGVTGGYYVAKQTETDVEITEQTEIVATALLKEKVAKVEKPISQEPSQRPAEQNQPKRSFTLNEILVKEESKTEKDYKKDLQEFANEAEVLIGLLEEDKNNYILLKSTVAEHRNKHIAHSIDLMSQWATVAIESSSSVPSDYKNILELTRDSIVADSDYLTGYINSLYEIVDLYFIDALKKRDVVAVISEDQDRLRECIGLDISEWVNDKMYLTCGMRLALTFGDDGSYTEDFLKIVDKLVEVDHLVFETIGIHTKQAEEDILDNLERIARLSGIVQSTQASLYMVSRQSEQGLAQPVPSTQSVRCYTTTNDSIFKKNRAYNTRCEPYTQTVAEKCALQKARSVSTSGVYIGGLVSAECK